MSSVVIIKSKEQYNELIKDRGTDGNITHVIVNFGAPWCRSCNIMYPNYQKLASKYPNIVFAKFNINENDEMNDLASELKITMLPTLHFHSTTKDTVYTPISTSNINEIIKKIDETLLGSPEILEEF